VPGPSAVLQAFDSLLEAGKFPEARRLCTGPMLRMFDFIALAQSKVAGLVDTARSRDTTLAEAGDGAWAWIKVSSSMVFKRPFLGQDSIRSIQAVHLYRAPDQGPGGSSGWRIAEMEELESGDSPVRLRSGVPEDAGPEAPSPGASAAAGGPGLFPVSSRAPKRAGEADRLRIRLRLKDGTPLAAICRLGPDQTLVRAVSPSEWILENRRHAWPARPRTQSAAPWPDSLRACLASNAFLDLGDSLLLATAARAAGRETDPRKAAEAVYRWVTENFRFRLGAVLFGTSREILRDPTGDCSEAAVLTAALLRARGIPARVALGFASLGRGVFIGHAWCEAWIDGAWTGVDAALREFPAGVERVKLSDVDGGSDMRIAATNLMMRAISNLGIEILGAWKNGKELPLQAYPGNAAESEKFFGEILKGMD
jgi:transglutaminase-like putative cysteine protease